MRLSWLPPYLAEKAKLERPGSWPVKRHPCTWALGKPEPAVTPKAHPSLLGGMPESESDPQTLGGSPRLGVLKLGVEFTFGEMSESGVVQNVCGSPGLGLSVLVSYERGWG